MTRIRDAAEGVWEFIAGDDWVTAAGVVVALGMTALITDADSAWFVMPAGRRHPADALDLAGGAEVPAGLRASAILLFER